MKIIYCLLFTFLLHTCVLGQSKSFRHFVVEHGLSNNTVLCSLQDKMGFMWFGTKDGLNRFDGYSFKTFRRQAGQKQYLNNNFINALFEDNRGVLWIGTGKGLHKFERNTETFELVTATADLGVQKITQDKEGNLWLIAEFALYKYVDQSGKLEVFDKYQFFMATSLCTTPEGVVWIGTMDGQLQRLNSDQKTFSSFDLFKENETTPYRWIESLYATQNGKILAGTSNREVKLIDPYRQNYKDFTIPHTAQPNLYIRCIQQTGANEFWIGTENGVFVFNIENGSCAPLQKDYNNPYSISDNAIYTFCRDKEGGVWVGTYFGGINYFPNQLTPFTKYFPRKGENSLSGNVVREIQKDKYGKLWIGTEDAGLNKLDPATGRFTNYTPDGTSNSISFFNIHGILATGNELWVGTFDHGLDVMDIRAGKVTRHFGFGGRSALVSQFIYSIYPWSADTILISTPSGCFGYDRKKDSLTWFSGLPSWVWYSSLLKDRKGNLWAGSFGKGAFYYNTATAESANFTFNEQDPKSLSSDRVNAIFEDSGGNLWFATEEGLCKKKASSNSFERYGTADGFPSNFILALLEDEERKLWISTTKGLVCFDPVSNKVRTYTTANGLLSDQFNYSSAFKDTDGRMYFGSAKGLISFHPKEFKQNTFVPPLYITGIQVNNKAADIGSPGSPLQKAPFLTNSITLAYDQSTFSLDFAALGFTAPDMLRYRYRMEGLSNNWINLNQNRRVDFTDLPPGTYTFRVKASVGEDDLHEQEKVLTIKILPPWWKSPLARATYIALSLLLLFATLYYYHRRMEEKNTRKIEMLTIAQEKEILKVELAKEKEILQAKVDFFTNVAHEIRTPLTLIKTPLARIIKKTTGIPELRSSLEIMERNTQRLIDLTSQLLDFRQTEINKFHLSLELVEIRTELKDAYASFQTMAAAEGIDLTINLPETPFWATVDRDAFNKIIYNLLSNAVKYADTKANLSLLPIRENNPYFTIEVQNDGRLIPDALREKIFEPFYRIREREFQTGTGIGLTLSRSLAQLHNGTLSVKAMVSNMNVFVLTLPIDQKTENNPQQQFLPTTKENPER